MADERTTSHAKTVELSSYQQTALDRQEAVKARYNEAATGERANEQRATSYAKTVDLPSYQQTALDRQAAIKARYNEAAEGQDQSTTAQQQTGAQGQGVGEDRSIQVGNQKPAPHLKPQGPARNAVDAQMHRQDMAKDDAAAMRAQRALERNEKAKRANSTRDGVNLNKDGNSKD